jgi:2-polyprenyl-3-methyl-5-hydroxy-6-metoxy-1,4-benzoquinol methylase
VFISKHRRGSYSGLPEKASKGLHAAAFELFRKHVRSGAKVLDLGSGAGAWAKRLHDRGHSVTACDLEAPTDRFDFPWQAVDLNRNFGEMRGKAQFGAVSLVEVIEHLENPRHVFRQIKSLLKREASRS